MSIRPEQVSATGRAGVSPFTGQSSAPAPRSARVWPWQPSRLRATETRAPARVLPANEQQAIELGLNGPCWWEDSEALERRSQERRAARYVWL